MGEYLTPALKNSKFRETGRLTPEEFVLAGDFLVYKCPTWAWSSGESPRRRSILPKDKQFLITRNGLNSFMTALSYPLNSSMCKES